MTKVFFFRNVIFRLSPSLFCGISNHIGRSSIRPFIYLYSVSVQEHPT